MYCEAPTRIKLGNIYTHTEGLAKENGTIYAVIVGNAIVQTNFVACHCSHPWYFSFDPNGSCQAPALIQCGGGVET